MSTASKSYYPQYSVPTNAWVNDSHSLVVGYVLWIVGFTGAHRFYYGKPLTGLLWFFTGGLLGIGWIVDFFLLPGMDDEADFRFVTGKVDYSIAWVLLVFLGYLGVHRMYMGKFVSGIIYLLTFGLFGIGIVYDVLTMNASIDEINREYRGGFQQYGKPV